MTTTEWAVTVGAAVGEPLPDEIIDALCDFLAPYGGGLSLDDDVVEATMTVPGADAVDAARAGRDLLARALGQSGLVPTSWPLVEAMTTREQDRRLAEPSIPPLVGVAEIAEILGVSKQRVSELKSVGGFPTPVATLASGPVWVRAALERFVETWHRRPGRPRIAKVG